MSSFIKSKLKAARDAISQKDYKNAREAALQVLEFESSNYTAYVQFTWLPVWLAVLARFVMELYVNGWRLGTFFLD